MTRLVILDGNRQPVVIEKKETITVLIGSFLTPPFDFVVCCSFRLGL